MHPGTDQPPYVRHSTSVDRHPMTGRFRVHCLCTEGSLIVVDSEVDATFQENRHIRMALNPEASKPDPRPTPQWRTQAFWSGVVSWLMLSWLIGDHDD